MKNNLYTEVYKFSSSPSIVALENKVKKKVLIFASFEPGIYLSKLVSSLITKKHSCKELIQDRTKLRLHILETDLWYSRNEEFRWSVSYWHNYYTKLGYSFYNTGLKPRKYILHVKIDYRYGVMVELCNKANKGFVIGVFSTMDQTETWIDQYYPNLDDINPVFACNLETIEYYKNL